jgi:hypothetical protein
VSGRIEYLSQYSIVIFSLAAASVDILRSKIPNSMTFSFMVFGKRFTERLPDEKQGFGVFLCDHFLSEVGVVPLGC